MGHQDRYLHAINGHRDVGPDRVSRASTSTARLPAIRRLAAADQSPFTSRQKTTNLSGSRWPDLVVRDATTHEVYEVRTGGQVGYRAGVPAASLLAGTDLVAAPGDMNGDQVPDLLARDSATGRLSLYPGSGAGGFGAPTAASSRFAGLDQLTGVGDLNLDGSNDIVGRDAATDRLYLYRGNGAGGYFHRRLLAPDWSGYDLTAGVGDLNGDGQPDLLARAGDQLWLVPGTGPTSIGTPVLLPGSWAGYDLLSGAGDVTNDGKPDVVARNRRTGLAYVFPGDGHGGLGHPYGPYPGFQDVDYLAVAGNVTGRRWDDLVGRTGQGDLVVFANDGRHNVTRTVDTHVAFPDANLILKAGDWNGDGRGDVIARSSRGDLWLYSALAYGRLAPGVKMSAGWGDVRMLAAVGDVTGDGYPDLMGQPARRGHADLPGRRMPPASCPATSRTTPSPAMPRLAPDCGTPTGRRTASCGPDASWCSTRATGLGASPAAPPLPAARAGTTGCSGPGTWTGTGTPTWSPDSAGTERCGCCPAPDRACAGGSTSAAASTAST